jgi:hypothetical protein
MLSSNGVLWEVEHDPSGLFLRTNHLWQAGGRVLLEKRSFAGRADWKALALNTSMSHDGNSGAGLILRRALVLQFLPYDSGEGRKDLVASDPCHCIRGERYPLELSPPSQCLFVSFQEQISVAPSPPV